MFSPKSRPVACFCITLLTLLPILRSKAYATSLHDYGRALETVRFPERIAQPTQRRPPGDAERAATVLAQIAADLERLGSDLEVVSLPRSGQGREPLDRIEERISATLAETRVSWASFKSLEGGLRSELEEVGEAGPVAAPSEALDLAVDRLDVRTTRLHSGSQ